MKKTVVALLLFYVSVPHLYALTLEEQTGEAINYAEKRETLKEQTAQTRDSVYKLEPIEAIADEIPVEECFEIEAITFPGATLLSESQQEAFTEGFFEECDSIQKLNDLTKRVTNFYVGQGYITSQAFLKPQDLSDGEIEISVLEGRIEEIVSNELYVGLIYPGYEGGLLNIHELKSGLKMLNRLKSKRAKMTLKAGSKSGYSIVKIDYTDKERDFITYVNFSNHYGNDLEWFPLGIGFDWENPLDAHDKLTLHLNRTRQQNNKDISLGSSFSYELPVYRFVLALGHSQFTFDQSLRDVNYNYNSDGRNENYWGSIGYELYGSRQNKIELGLGATYKRNTTFLPNSVARAIDYRMAVGDASLKYTFFGESFFIETELKYYGGRTSDVGLFDNMFHKYTGDFSLTKYFGPEIPMIYTLEGYGQISNNELPGSEQISIGGPNTVRGHKYLGVGGSSGAYARNELLYEKRMAFANVYPYIAFDYGRVRCKDSVSCGELYGGAVGVRLQERNFNFDLSYAAPLQASEQDTMSKINLHLILNY